MKIRLIALLGFGAIFISMTEIAKAQKSGIEVVDRFNKGTRPDRSQELVMYPPVGTVYTGTTSTKPFSHKVPAFIASLSGVLGSEPYHFPSGLGHNFKDPKVRVYDFDGDGNVDIAYSADSPMPGWDVETRVYHCTKGTDGIFDCSLGALHDGWLLDLCDLNQNGKKELLIYSRIFQEYKLIEQSTPTADPDTLIWSKEGEVQGETLNHDGLCLGDLDNNGKQELVLEIGTEDEKSLQFFEVDINTQVTLTLDSPDQEYFGKMIAGDIDQDGSHEIFRTSSGLYVSYQIDATELAFETFGNAAGNNTTVKILPDMDGNGVNEIGLLSRKLVATGGQMEPTHLEFYEPDTPGVYTGAIVNTEASESNQPYDFWGGVLRDFLHPSTVKKDLIRHVGNQLKFYERNSAGEYIEKLSVPAAPGAIEVVDIDGDGKMEVLTSYDSQFGMNSDAFAIYTMK